MEAGKLRAALRRPAFLVAAIAALVFSSAAFLAGLMIDGPAALRRLSDAIGGGETERRSVVQTHLHRLEVRRIALPPSKRTGGAIEEVGGVLMFATPEGELGYVAADGRPEMLGLAAPMNEAGLREHPAATDPTFRLEWFRVHDLLPAPRGNDRFDLYISHHLFTGACIAPAISLLALTVRDGAVEPDPAGVQPFLEISPCSEFQIDKGIAVFAGHQSGGRMVRHDADSLLLSVGDYKLDGGFGHLDLNARLSREDYPYGKLLRVDLNTGAYEVYARGLRNPQGLAKDSQGRLWETEHGPMGGDELNLIEAGADYGWPRVTLGVQYGAKPWPYNPRPGRHDGAAPPHFAWLPSAGVTQVIEAPAAAFPHWAGDLLVASLRGEAVYRLRLSGERVIYAEPIPLGGRLRDLTALSSGEIAVLTDKTREILFLRRADPSEADPPKTDPPWLDEIAALDTPGRRVFEQSCAACHSLTFEHSFGPHLIGVVGRPAGRAPGFVYSDALAAGGRPWTRRRLTQFLRDPDAVAPGAAMGAVALSDQEMRDLIGFLERLTPRGDTPMATAE